MDVDMDEQSVSLSLMHMFVILDDGDKLRVSDDVKKWNETHNKYESIYLNISCHEFNFPVEVAEFVHENNVIYIPRFLHQLFVEVMEVDVMLIDPKSIKNIGMIVIKPTISDFREKYTQGDFIKMFSGIPVISRRVPIPTKKSGFEIVYMIAEDGTHIDIGNTLKYVPRIVVIENIDSGKQVLQKQDNNTMPLQTVSDYSPIKTNVYKKMYIKNGVVVYIK